MNAETAPTLPRLSTLPIGACMEATVGFTFGKLFRTNAGMAAAITAIYFIGKQILYHTTNKLIGNGQELRSHKIFVATFSITHTAFLVALRQFNIIGQPGFLWLGAFGSIVVAHRSFWIYKHTL
ncbi:putative membrane protein [Candidatus Protochlamydia naegleriophila]|uniref:Putative membrane protein n=1 Tax=Candidatus Protochlamydia naegleriophila TaxID=389348 RepID=A0A0U5JA94_9BACT|nr:hypothetical protein [Candidatus Protochlamydia naegleriophila]CUI16039.1 putative membrane protein [Candidatus Protochlamydia naegleriophila]